MKEQSGIRWAYEEMVAACNEMRSGIAEARAYERFGRRCEQTCYVRLGTILSGGLQKSSEGMTELLLNEAEEAMEDRRQLAKKKQNWIDFNCGVMVNDTPLDELSENLLDFVLEIASGKKSKSEEAGFHDMAIFKQGVTL